MIRLLIGWLTLSVFVAAAWSIYARDWSETRKPRPSNEDAIRERMALLRQRLAHPEESEDEEWVGTNTAPRKATPARHRSEQVWGTRPPEAYKPREDRAT